MDMRVNSSLIKQLRNQRAWSQDQLSLISGISHRTIQRIESSGTCSLESLRALAVAFEIETSVLEIDPTAQANMQRQNKEIIYAYSGVSLGLLGAYGGVTAALLSGGMSYYQAGIYFGAIGALMGGTCLIIRALSKRGIR